MCRIRSDQLLIVPRFQARVLVRLRPSVLDQLEKLRVVPLNVWGWRALANCGSAKPWKWSWRLRMKQSPPQVGLLSDRLLANPVIEDWTLELQQSQASGSSFSRFGMIGMCSGPPRGAWA